MQRTCSEHGVYKIIKLVVEVTQSLETYYDRKKNKFWPTSSLKPLWLNVLPLQGSLRAMVQICNGIRFCNFFIVSSFSALWRALLRDTIYITSQ